MSIRQISASSERTSSTISSFRCRSVQCFMKSLTGTSTGFSVPPACWFEVVLGHNSYYEGTIHIPTDSERWEDYALDAFQTPHVHSRLATSRAAALKTMQKMVPQVIRPVRCRSLSKLGCSFGALPHFSWQYPDGASCGNSFLKCWVPRVSTFFTTLKN